MGFLSYYMSCSLNVKESSSVNMPYLPDDILLKCLAHLPRVNHKTLSLVSERLCSLLASKELYKTRKLLGISEDCLYVCLQLPHSFETRWFTLSREPTRIPPRWFGSPCFNLHRISTRNFMTSVPSGDFDFSHPWYWKTATIGYHIYMIGECSTKVFVMDCRSHTWLEAPTMHMARKNPLVSVVDGKIYVLESLPGYNCSNFMEVFDPETQRWEHALSPDAEICGNRIYCSFAKEGDLYLSGDKNLVYKPKENKWGAVRSELRFGKVSSKDSYCTIDNVDYISCYYTNGVISRIMIKWYDSVKGYWGVLKGLEGLPISKLRNCYHDCVRIVNYGGNIAVSWSEDDYDIGSTKIWCAEIEIKRRKYGHELRGKVKWCDVVLTVPVSWTFKQLVVATV